MRASACCGVSPSAERTARPDSACPSSPATRTWKNSSRFDEKIAQNFTRSSSGSDVVRRELEDAGVELEVGELAIEESLHRFRAGSRRHHCILYRQRRLRGLAPVNAGVRLACANARRCGKQPARLVATPEERRGGDRAGEEEDDQVAAGHARDDLHERADEPGGGERQDPGEDDVSGDPPADRRRTPCSLPRRRRSPRSSASSRPGTRDARSSRGSLRTRVCAANPCGGSIFAIRVPIVRMIRQPPA